MNIFLWILQILLAGHTVMGAVWKFSHSEQSVSSLKAMPHLVWLGLIGVELLCGIALVVAALHKPLAFLIPIGAAGIAAEMLLFTAFHFSSGETNHGPVAYWLVVAALAGFTLYGRVGLSPL